MQNIGFLMTWLILFLFDRMWDIDNEENYILTLEGHSGYDQHENITCIHYSEKKGLYELSYLFIPRQKMTMMIIVSTSFKWLTYLSRVVRKPAFCICENKDADQLHGNHEADQRLCFRYKDSTIPLLSKSEISSL